MSEARRAALLAALVLAGAAAAAEPQWIVRQLTTSRGDPIEVRYVEQGAAAASDARVTMMGTMLQLGLEQGPNGLPETGWSFVFKVAPGAPALARVVVEDVTQAPTVTLVTDAEPKVDGGRWIGQSARRPISTTTDAWMLEPTTELRVFRIEAAFADGSKSVLHQPSVFAYPAKLRLWAMPMAAMDRRRVEQGTAPGPAILERWSFGFDGRGWALGYQVTDGRQSVREYVLPGEQVERWTELVTSAAFIAGPSAADLTETFTEALERSCRKVRIETLPGATEHDVTIEWWHDGCGDNPPQHELRRTVSRDGNTYALSYVAKTAKKKRLDPERRSAWLAALRAAELR